MTAFGTRLETPGAERTIRIGNLARAVNGASLKTTCQVIHEAGGKIRLDYQGPVAAANKPIGHDGNEPWGAAARPDDFEASVIESLLNDSA